MIPIRKKIIWILPLVACLAAGSMEGQTISGPEEFFGHRMGAEQKLARWDRIVEYMRLVHEGSDRVVVEEVGKSTNGHPSSKFDAVIFPDMRKEQIIRGLTADNVPPEYKGGIEESGMNALRTFILKGGIIIALGRSSELMMDELAVPFRDSLQDIGREDFLCPGSILRVLVDNTHPLAYGMPDEVNAYFSNSLAANLL